MPDHRSHHGPPVGSSFVGQDLRHDQWADTLFVQRAITQENTLGLGVRDTQRIVQTIGACGVGYFLVRITGRSISGEGLVGTTPTTAQVANGSRTLGSLQFRIEFSSGATFDQEIDIDGGRGVAIGTWAAAVRVYLLRDANTFVIPTPGQSPNQVTAGGQSNVYLSASINRVTNIPRGDGTVTISRLVAVATNNLFAIPPFCRFVRVLQEEAAPAGVPVPAMASGPWNFVDQNLNAIGILPFVPGERYTPRTIIPDGAVFLRTDRDNAAQRMFSAAFEINV